MTHRRFQHPGTGEWIGFTREQMFAHLMCLLLLTMDMEVIVPEAEGDE